MRPEDAARRAHSALAASKSSPCKTALAPRRWTLRTLMSGVPLGMTMVQGMPRRLPESATPCA